MAKEYIERNDVMDRITFCRMEDPETKVERVTGVVRTKDILAIPAADVVEVKRGRWVHTDEALTLDAKDECSECSFHTVIRRNLSRLAYCPNCGAKMDGGNDHE